MYCNNCGAQIPDGSKFCNNCGFPLPTNHGNIIVEEKHAPRIESGKRSWGKLIIAVLLLLVFIVACYLLFNPETSNLYRCSKISYFTVNGLTAEDKEFIDDYFEGSYLLKNSDGFLVANLESGLGFTEKDLESLSLEEEGMSVEISINPNNSNYAYVEITNKYFDDKVTITYIKASFGERLAFLSKYYF